MTRTYFDADSHLMESLDWLAGYATGRAAEVLGEIDLGAGGGDAAMAAVQAGVDRIADTDATAALRTPEVLNGTKGWPALGAMDPAERTDVLDLTGIGAQLVFSTFSSGMFAFSKDPEVVYGGAAAHNRGITEFCADDDRLLPVAFVPTNDIDGAMRCLDEAIDLGAAAAWIPFRAMGGVSPGHLDWDPFWHRLVEAGVTPVLHIGGGRSTISKAFHQNGRPIPPDHIGGGENLRAKDYPSVHHAAETFLSALILDGVFDRVPELRMGVIELGAHWVPGFVRSIDHAAKSFARFEPVVRDLEQTPSEYIRQHLRFTPFPFEDVGWLIEQAGTELFLFSTDYPHPEGGRNPVAKFTTHLDATGIDDAARTAFFSENFTTLFPQFA